MRITKQWLEHTFQFYNNKYFSGKLKTPLFNLSCPPGNWGYYQPNGNFNKRTRKVTKLKGPGTIFIASDYEREKKDIIATLLHEMIHMYINTVLKIYPYDSHGSDFKKIANIINADGWNISEYNEKKDANSRNTSNEKENNTLLFVIYTPDSTSNKFWAFKGYEDKTENYIETCKKLPSSQDGNMLTIFKYFSPKFANMPIAQDNLEGVGGMTYDEVMTKLKNITKDNLIASNIKRINSIKL